MVSKIRLCGELTGIRLDASKVSTVVHLTRLTEFVE